MASAALAESGWMGKAFRVFAEKHRKEYSSVLDDEQLLAEVEQEVCSMWQSLSQGEMADVLGEHEMDPPDVERLLRSLEANGGLPPEVRGDGSTPPAAPPQKRPRKRAKHKPVPREQRRQYNCKQLFNDKEVFEDGGKEWPEEYDDLDKEQKAEVRRQMQIVNRRLKETHSTAKEEEE